MLCEAKAKADTPSVVTTPRTASMPENPPVKRGASPPKMETSKNQEEEIQLRRKIERLKQDLERYATSFEAGFLQRRSEEEAKDMMEKVSTLKEYERERAQAQRDGSGKSNDGETQTESVAALGGLSGPGKELSLDQGDASLDNKPDDTHDEEATHPPTAGEDLWEVWRLVNDKILLILSAANIRRKEMQSRCKESAGTPDPKEGTASVEEAQKLIRESTERDERGIRKRNPKRMACSVEKWETSGIWKQIIQEGNEASDRLADTIHLLHIPHAPTSLQAEVPPPRVSREWSMTREGGPPYIKRSWKDPPSYTLW